MQLATVAIEDQRFYEHGGIDPEGILRAAVKDVEAGEAVEGGSTITQQLVRNLCIQNPERNLERKIIEAKLAEEYAARHSRRRNPRLLPQHRLLRDGRGRHRGRGRRRLEDLLLQAGLEADLPQAALLAGLPQAPSEYNPILNPGPAKARRNEVLRKMAKLGFLAPSAPGRRSQRARARRLRRATSSTASPTSSTTSRTS